jgi:hypothetical protein
VPGGLSLNRSDPISFFSCPDNVGDEPRAVTIQRRVGSIAMFGRFVAC